MYVQLHSAVLIFLVGWMDAPQASLFIEASEVES
jgi:hypothetical protein